jgi:predicted XRE-type DNA-binding protein
MQEPVYTSSGNVFADLGFDTAEAAVLQLCSRLLNDLRNHLGTSPDALRQLGLSETRATELIQGQWEKFSLETLIMLQARVGRELRFELVTV